MGLNLIRMGGFLLAVGLRNDPETLWAWQCNLAMMAADAGADPYQANERAADFLTDVFGADPRQTEYWESLGWEPEEPEKSADPEAES